MSGPLGGNYNKLSYYVNMANAVNERCAAWLLSSTLPANVITVPTAGTRIDTFLQSCQVALESQPYVSKNWNPDGVTPATIAATDYGLRTYCGLPTGQTPFLGSLGVGDNLMYFWRRKKPRTVSSLTASQDTDTNPAASGQRAFYNPSGGQDAYIVKYDGSNWNRCYDGMPDVLDSINGYPNGCVPGSLQIGDYIGSWIFTELTAIINNMVTVSGLFSDGYPLSKAGSWYLYVGSGLANGNSYYGDLLPDCSAGAEAGYGPSTAGTGGGASPFPESGFIPTTTLSGRVTGYSLGGGEMSAGCFYSNRNLSSGTGGAAGIRKTQGSAIEYCNVTGQYSAVGAWQNRTTRFYSGPNGYDLAAPYGFFNDQGDPVSATAYTKFGSASGTNSSPASVVFGSTACPTSFSPLNSFNPNTESVQANYTTQMFYVQDFTGFAYTV